MESIEGKIEKSIRIFYPCGATSPSRRKRPLDYNNASYGLEL